jgi:ketosteroid isomerase-like protein
MTGTAPDGTPIRQSGLSVAVLRKQADGKWLMVFDNPFGQHLLDKR